MLMWTSRRLPSICIFVVFVTMVWFITPKTIFSYPLEKVWEFCLSAFKWQDIYGKLNRDGAVVIYLLGWVSLFGLLIGYGYLRFMQWGRIGLPVTYHFTDMISLFLGLYLLDFFTSTTHQFPYGESLWIFAIAASFFLLVWFMNSQRDLLLLLVKLLVFIITEQCIYAIVYYALAYEQFYTPHFGNRTGGTFYNPGCLYPLCLIGLPLSMILAERESSHQWRWLWLGSGMIMLLALIFTYSRAGWLALSVSAFYLAYLPRSPLQRHCLWRWMLGLLIVVALLGIALVRTKGKLIGNSEDRPFWGRFAIWQVAVRAIADHPFLGSGLNSYLQKQQEHITLRLKWFNPMNLEAKNLFLNIAVEFGLIGLGIFLLLIWRYVQLYRFAIRIFSPSDDAYAVTIGIHASLLGIFLAGFFDTPILHFTRSASSFAVAFLLGILCALVNQANPAPIHDEIEIRRRKLRFRRILATGFVAFLPVVIYLLCLLGAGIKRAKEALPQIQRLAKHSPKNSSFVHLKDIAEDMVYAVVASEDGYFYSHHGVDWLALHRALRKNLRAMGFVQGGSTITMQVARYLFLSRERTISRKIAEIFLALKMERYLSKERILELYLNTAHFGMGQDGILAAARNYFGKHPKDLTLSEAAFLAGVLPEPPFDRRKVTPEFVWRCQRRVLERLHAFFSQKYPLETLEKAQKTPLRFKWGQVITPLAGGVKK